MGIVEISFILIACILTCLVLYIYLKSKYLRLLEQKTQDFELAKVNIRSELFLDFQKEKDLLLDKHKEDRELWLRQSKVDEDTLRHEFENEKQSLLEQISGLRQENVALTTKIEAMANNLKLRESYEKELEEKQKNLLEQMRESFKALSLENSSIFKVKSSEAITDLLKPMQDKFTEFSKIVRESQDKNIETNAKLNQKIDDLEQRSKNVGDQAKNLANALTGYAKIQGDFGEMLLADILKNAGMVEGIHFQTQGVMTDMQGNEIKSDMGKTMIPDVMVFYPDNTTVIIDSKMSLSSYVDYMNADDIESRKFYAKAHIASITAHIDELKKKDYASYLSEGQAKVPYNIMFVPVEGAFRLMLEESPRLWQIAKDNNVLIVSNMTLIIVLNMISMAWKQYNQEKNIENVYKVAEELMSQIQSWLESYDKLGDYLSKASKSYEDSKRRLKESNQSVIKKIYKLQDLGINSRRGSNAKIRANSRKLSSDSVVPQSLQLSDIEQVDEQNILNSV